ncbi:DUF262 domain-containing HNH endonuclease family protein [Hamadaea sp. NPDC050747]|uniref:DUF262 domain-containing protein n=1 Tax=Hamadaea sp. NPDC050747 TaxID=3155789 RepID=UPI0033E8C496
MKVGIALSKTLESGMLPVTKLFSQDYFFRVPEYQRPFLWDADDFTDLIDDLMGTDQDEPYFLGTLVLHRRAISQYDIVDGQQRLTALCILLACLRDAPAINDQVVFRNEIHEKVIQPERQLDGIPARNRLEVRDQAVFNSLIGTMDGAAKPLSDLKDDPSERRYELARAIFWEKISKMTSEQVKAFAAFVTQKCSLIYLATDSFDDAFRLFTVVNDRGKQLRRIDVLKAHNLDPNAVPNDGARIKYASRWESMEAQLGEGPFEEVFHLLRLIYVKDKPQADLYSEFLNRIYAKKELPEPGSNFLDELTTYVDLYDSLFIARDYLDAEDGTPDARYHTLMEAMVTYFTASEWKACILSFAKRFDKSDLYAFALRLEKVYLDLWVRGVRKDERYGIYTKILRNIQDSQSPADAIDAMTPNLKAIEDACRISGFYGAGYAKYLLVRAEIVSSELDHPRHFYVRSVEHVLPQNPGQSSAWMDTFTDEERKQLVNTAGNLVLLSKSKNSSASNKNFGEKKDKYLKPRVSDFPRSMEVLGYNAWTPDVVKERTEQFAKTVLSDP